MGSRQDTAIGLLIVSVLGWLFFAYGILILPRQVAAWDAADVALPNPVILMINIGLLLQRLGLLVVLLLLCLTGTGIWLLRSEAKSESR
ncbi:MAG: hypothetical protein ACPGVU_15960 [Limisphaerales bacterium]